ncbi:unnamed protein product [Protopolystoma xenopodis]|uniref:Uncharacterized protein n=1 Tax=Protopolystoma xenopodis TaxID=117903 RepID=A0A3S5FGG1_9PLAT|nr:unnamed protein product [Protopolystoma xenopodis]
MALLSGYYQLSVDFRMTRNAAVTVTKEVIIELSDRDYQSPDVCFWFCLSSSPLPQTHSCPSLRPLGMSICSESLDRGPRFHSTGHSRQDQITLNHGMQVTSLSMCAADSQVHVHLWVCMCTSIGVCMCGRERMRVRFSLFLSRSCSDVSMGAVVLARPPFAHA